MLSKYKIMLWRLKSQVEEKNWMPHFGFGMLWANSNCCSPPRRYNHTLSPLFRLSIVAFQSRSWLSPGELQGDHCQPGLTSEFSVKGGAYLSDFVLDFTSTNLNLILVVIQDGHLPSKSLVGTLLFHKVVLYRCIPRTLPSTRASPDFWTMVSSSPK